MELIIMPLGGSLAALSLQLSDLIRDRALFAPIQRVLAFGHSGGWRGPTRADRKMAWVVAVAIALIPALSPARSAASILPATVDGAHNGIAARAADAEEHSTPAASLTQSPLVMRMSKDEFRVAFGIKSVGCAANGCRGVIRYRVRWQAEDGTTRWETREVDYAVVPHSTRTITVDRQYFDTAEGAHTTDVVQVIVARVTCEEASVRSDQMASTRR
jgi:hypothetical protein